MFLYNMYMLFLFFLTIIMFVASLSFMILDTEVYLEFIFLVLNFISVEYVIFLDWVSTMFLSVVLFISSMIFYYMKDYMSGEKNYVRFIYLMLMFISSMMFMIMSMDLIAILIGWDGLGLVSYLLVIFYQNMKSNSAGMLTALSNRIGDAFFLLSIAMMMNFGSWKFMFIYEEDSENLMIILFMLMMAAMTKSAQIPFSSWLPAAMAAPTPVSSLVHSSTLVTAGVYLLIRIVDMMNSSLLLILLYSSLLTMFMAGLNANFEYDLKKIIALSTLSQLGMMIVIICLGSKELALFHLFIHALFKALLFMCAGAMIYNFHGLQDMRLMGGALKYLPITSVCLVISNLSLCGIPFLSGFYSKDLIVEVLSMSAGLNMIVYILFYVSIGLTVSYSFRFMYHMFFSEMNYLSLSCFSDKNNLNMNNSMLGLVVFVVFMGSCLMWVNLNFPFYIILPNFMKMLVMIMIIMGVILGVFMNWFKFSMNLMFQMLFGVYFLFSSMWYLSVLSTKGVSTYFLKGGEVYFSLVDNGWMEFYGSVGLMKMMMSLSQFMQLFSKNNIKMYLIVTFMFLLLLLFM
uniref:NADH dehydrogenase subunit 5 n=1 Tax=Scolytoplatypus wugongshanensis TaxID=2894162 RepID=UPI0023AAFBB9|nr:NADH dehydrogenase subunit 5 [Scolytoplatypus wugongshanensis]WCB99742.1 NADH dehydrogenase subunit 5 [Scolytoplatypus wugongshanensis]